MKASVCVAALAIAISCLARGEAVDEQLKKLENDWANAEMKKEIAVLDKIMADDLSIVDPQGNVVTKAQAIASLSSGEDVVSSLSFSEMKVRVYGNTAVVTYLENAKEKFQGKDVGGTARWTDTWVKHGNSWQCVASHGSRVSKP